MEAKIKPTSFDGYHIRLIYLGLVLNLLVPVALLGLGFVLRQSAFSEIQGLDFEVTVVILFVVSLADLVSIYFLKKRTLANFASGISHSSSVSDSASAQLRSEKAGLIFALLIYSLCLAPSIYGLVYFLLGGNLNWFILLVAITLAGFLLFKPKEQELKKFFREETTNL